MNILELSDLDLLNLIDALSENDSKEIADLRIKARNKIFSGEFSINPFARDIKINEKVTFLRISSKGIASLLGKVSEEDINFLAKKFRRDFFDFLECDKLQGAITKAIQDGYTNMSYIHFVDSLLDLDISLIKDFRAVNPINHLKRKIIDSKKQYEHNQWRMKKANGDSGFVPLPSLASANEETCKRMLSNLDFYSAEDKKKLISFSFKKFFHILEDIAPFEALRYALDNGVTVPNGLSNLIKNAMQKQPDKFPSVDLFIEDVKEWYYDKPNLGDYGWKSLEHFMRFWHTKTNEAYYTGYMERLIQMLIDIMNANPDLPLECLLSMDVPLEHFPWDSCPPLCFDTPMALQVCAHKTHYPDENNKKFIYAAYHILNSMKKVRYNKEGILTVVEDRFLPSFDFYESDLKLGVLFINQLVKYHFETIDSLPSELSNNSRFFKQLVLLKCQSDTMDFNDYRFVYNCQCIVRPSQEIIEKTIDEALDVLDFQNKNEFHMFFETMLDIRDTKNRQEAIPNFKEETKKALIDKVRNEVDGASEIIDLFDEDFERIFQFLKEYVKYKK